MSLSRDERIASASASASTAAAASPPASDMTTLTRVIPDALTETDMDDEAMSLFDIGMPGVLTLDELRTVDLDHWLLVVQGSFVHMIVSVSVYLLEGLVWLWV